MNVNKLLIALPLTLTLAACGAPTVEEFSADKELLNKTLAECNEMSVEDVRSSEACNNAATAMVGGMLGSFTKGMKGG